jgi:hypothetical protein
LSRTLIRPRPKLEIINRYSPPSTPSASAPDIQNSTGSNQSKSISLLVERVTPAVPPIHDDFVTNAAMISANTHIAIEK